MLNSLIHTQNTPSVESVGSTRITYLFSHFSFSAIHTSLKFHNNYCSFFSNAAVSSVKAATTYPINTTLAANAAIPPLTSAFSLRYCTTKKVNTGKMIMAAVKNTNFLITDLISIRVPSRKMYVAYLLWDICWHFGSCMCR